MYKRNFEDLIETVTSLGPKQGIEIVAPEFDRGYPALSPEFERRFKNAREKYDFVPTAWSGYIDPQRITGRYTTREEKIEYLKLQIEAAATLGFPNIRLQVNDVIEDIIPFAEKKGVSVGVEMHAPMTIESMGKTIERIKKMDSPYYGLVPDSGAFCRQPSEVYFKRFVEQGVSKEIADAVLKMWKEEVDLDKMVAEVRAMGGNEIAELMAVESNVYFGHADPKSLIPLMKYIHHFHGKFFNVNDAGEESAVRVPELVSVLSDGGFEGYISCEYEGHHWYTDVDTLDQIKRYQALVCGCLTK
jgi:sugar phosphate isomerase/epimerase